MHPLRAASIFWCTVVLGGVAGSCVATSVTHYDPSNEWGGAQGAFVAGVVVSVVLGALAALFHGAAVFLLGRVRPETVASDRAASSVLTALAVLVVGLLGILSLDPQERDGWPLLIVAGPLPFVLSLLVVPAVNRFYRARGDGGAAVGE